ncbi:smad nuclear-interacting protein 1 [Rhinoderma darwinii]|uniref:smad nuclear-interacting protein 1 n=1 Tax=Rhinoderma darwinii TaxID=43563 RepID=UPI003F66FDFA
MKEVKDEGRRKKRRPCIPDVTLVKEERGSPNRRHRARRSPSSGNTEGDSPVARKRSRSPEKRKKSSIKRSRSPRTRRHKSESRSPPQLPVKIKQERDEHSHRTRDDRQHMDREEEPRRNRLRDQTDRGRYDPTRHRERDREENNFREQRAEREFQNDRRRERRQRAAQEEGEQGNESDSSSNKKEAPNFGLSGALLEDTNTFRGVVIKYSEPPEARVPKKRWRLYPFKNDEALPVMYIHRQSAYLLGRQRRIADIPIDHPSCSKQHAVLQYRMVEFTRADGTIGRRVRPYIIDLGSGNGTYLNNQRMEPQRYYELKEKDVLKFGFSSREYVVLHESSDTSEVDHKQDDDDDEEDEGTDGEPAHPVPACEMDQ